MLIFAHLGWGKPVQINPRNFNRKISMSAGEAIVALAGPLMNFILSIVFTVVFCLTIKFAGAAFMTTTIGKVIITMISSCIVVNVGLGVFNLIPLPPLDGSKILKNMLPYNARIWMESHEMLFYLIFLIIWITPGLTGIIISPIINAVTDGLTFTIGRMFGLFM
jgi:Zn-dependent protease